MSNANYTVRGTGTFTSYATVAAAVTPLATTITMAGLQSIGPGDRFTGMAVMIGDEIVKLTSWTDTSIVVTRGCADTIPAAHPVGTPIWFFEQTVGTDLREYFAAETIGVKVLAKTTSRRMPIEYSPPVALTFGGRFIKPYPPGNLQGNGVPWFNVQTLTAAAPNLVLTWAHRNRVTQMDVLIPHGSASVTPETGTTYRLRFFTAGDTLVSTVTGITGTTYTIPRSAMITIYGLAALSDTGNYPAYALLDTERDGYSSTQAYRLDFLVDTTGIVVSAPRYLEDGTTTRVLEDGTTTRILE